LSAAPLRLNPELCNQVKQREAAFAASGEKEAARAVSRSCDDYLRQMGYREYSRYLSFHFPFTHERSLLEHLRACPWKWNQSHFKVWAQLSMLPSPRSDQREHRSPITGEQPWCSASSVSSRKCLSSSKCLLNLSFEHDGVSWVVTRLSTHKISWVRQAWRQGRTGYPLVDAAMRELWSTGWIHNRMRVVCASFLVKNLLLPWQWGLKHFWDAQLDADLESAALGWQYVSGCLAGAACQHPRVLCLSAPAVIAGAACCRLVRFESHLQWRCGRRILFFE
jgi:FAD binding domain of DNA photolyase